MRVNNLTPVSLFLISPLLTATSVPERPNIIYILADDLGYGDLSCYGQQHFTTPHLDKMAQEGIRFTNHYSGSTVSAPTRACLMTGLHTGHSYVRGNSDNVLPAGVQTLTGMLKRSGYVTGMYGKWGLGNYPSTGQPDQQGFDEFFGYTNQGLAHRHYPDVLIDNGTTVMLPGNDWLKKVVYAPDTIHNRALDFIDRHHDQPFFLYCAYTIPHAEIIIPDDSIFNLYKGKFTETPRKGSDYIGPGTSKTAYCSQEYPKATFSAMIARLDWYVGQIMEKLDKYGLAENTIVMFTSDNGPHQEGGADPVFFNSSGGFKGIKRDLYDGGIRVPFIVQWKGKVLQGVTSDHISAQWDVMPTIKEVIGSTEDYAGDGISFLPAMMQMEQKSHRYLYWEFYEKNGRRAIRSGDWKLIQYEMDANPNTNRMLFNLKDDPAESANVINNNPDVADKLFNAIELEHDTSDKLKWSFEKNSNLHDVKILVADQEGNPVNNAAVSLQYYGRRITWEEGKALFRGVTAGSLRVDVNVGGKQVVSETYNITRDSVISVVINTTGLASRFANTTSCYYDSKLKAVHVKSDFLMNEYSVLNVSGQLIAKGQCSGYDFYIPFDKCKSGLFFIETTGKNNEKNAQQIIVW